MNATSLAPHIGVLVFDKPPTEYLPRLRLRALAAEAALQGATLTFFCAADCDIDLGCIVGDAWVAGEWRTVKVSLPDIVLIVTTPRRPHHFSVQHWIRTSTAIIQDVGLDKLALSRALEQSPLAKFVIPYQVLGDGVENEILAWLNREEHLVIKPTDGRWGSNIFMVHRVTDGFNVHKDAGITLFESDKAAASYVTSRIVGRMHYRNYIVQKYVRSLTADGRTADFRVHIQRDGAGRWIVTRVYARLGDIGMATSNISRGAFQGPIESHLAGRSRPVEELSLEIVQLAIDIASRVDALRERPLSELGIDLMIDNDDRLWVIESNARPQSSLHEHDRAINTIAYALHLRSHANHMGSL